MLNFNENALNLILKDYITEDTLKMDNFIQHGTTSTLTHVQNVTELSYKIGKNLDIDIESLVIASFLHDFYLYDWHDPNKGVRLHGYRHPLIASNNASKYFNVDSKINKIIESHMWPLTLFHIPTCKEGWLLCYTDKVVAIKETFRHE